MIQALEQMISITPVYDCIFIYFIETAKPSLIKGDYRSGKCGKKLLVYWHCIWNWQTLKQRWFNYQIDQQEPYDKCEREITLPVPHSQEFQQLQHWTYQQSHLESKKMFKSKSFVQEIKVEEVSTWGGGRLWFWCIVGHVKELVQSKRAPKP